ncbi:hypothetical protein MJA45_20410 [Paenibacillus aurantius]|uniref:Uncharacterized protein n=1 Tax=Paenibacillus aurantius TaxID=2918900 RepID=A0AA96LAC8_9BACL|nr:hypothetical protein [Paenibacillus aurantius]WJH34753.1 hypothetical protein N6H14_00625 [Paenibacillus sp. CC-CFT747]WNQ09966.1 hypothetical protein MJA45_20410 [Paenibacillus aurantius]
MKAFQSIGLLSLTLGMIIYAVPQLEIGQGWTLPTIFGVVWLSMALLMAAAHLHAILGVDEETAEELNRIRRMKRLQLEKRLRGDGRLLPFRK